MMGETLTRHFQTVAFLDRCKMPIDVETIACFDETQCSYSKSSKL